VDKLPDRLTSLGEIMDRAAELALRIRREMTIQLKPDGSIVTEADKAVESFLREELPKHWPGTTFWGEEFGRDEIATSGYWLIDPIDGTSNFAFGSPLWGISVAFAVKGRIELGAVWLPDLGESYLAALGENAYCNSARLAPIPPGPVERHQLVSYNEVVLKGYSPDKMPGKIRCAGAFVVDGTFTARQRYRGMIGRNEYLYDSAACMLINEELGADVRWASGDPLPIRELLEGRRFDQPWLIFPKDSGYFLTDPQ
jgi:myo-inositol-1(or 4)-monophosphatase